MKHPPSLYKGCMMLRTLPPSPPYGWTESLWINKPLAEASLVALEEIAKCRMKILSNGVVIEKLRVTNPSISRVSVDSNLCFLKGTYNADYRIASMLLLLRIRGLSADSRGT